MRQHILAATLIVCMPVQVRAGPVPANDVPAVINAADLIVVGRAVSASAPTSRGDRTERYSIEVDRVLKGVARPGDRIGVRLDLSGDDIRGVAERQYGIHLLRHE